MRSFKDTLLAKIKSGEIDMKPRWHFVLQAVLLFTGLATVALISIYLLSFILFTLHQTGLWFAPTFGLRGVIFFVTTSPWLIILILGLFLGLLYILVSQYSFSYRKPLVYSIVGCVLFVIAASSVIQQTLIHERMRSFAEQHHLPGFHPLYRDIAGSRPEGVEVGTIVSLRDNTIDISTEDSTTVTVILDERTKQLPGTSFVPGDTIIVFGKKSDGVIQAFGIRPFNENMPPRPGKEPFERLSNPPSPSPLTNPRQ